MYIKQLGPSGGGQSEPLKEVHTRPVKAGAAVKEDVFTGIPC